MKRGCAARMRRADALLGLSLRSALIWLAVSATLFAITLAGKRFLGALLLTRLQIERVTLDLFNDVLLKDLTLKALERAFQAFAIVNLNFSQRNSPMLAIGIDSSG